MDRGNTIKTQSLKYSLTKRLVYLLLLPFTLSVTNDLFSQDIRFNEIMSSNSTFLSDMDGDFPDWIEFVNDGNDIINMSGYTLSDDSDEPDKWVFPDYTVESCEYFLLFASGKDIIPEASYWETILRQNTLWKYKLFTEQPAENWNQLDYADNDWSVGYSGFGYGDADDNTVINQTISIHIRKKFIIPDLGNIHSAFLHIDFDDAFIAYLNGVEIARANIGTFGDLPNFDAPAENSHEALIYQGEVPEIYEIPINLFIEGHNVLAIEGHNISINSSDFTLNPFLSFLEYNIPLNPLGSAPELNLPKPRLHSNFKISSGGESLYLYNPEGQVVDTIGAYLIPSDISLGRYPENSSTWLYYKNPSPGSENNSNGYSSITEDVQFSLPGGFYDHQISLSLSTSSQNDSIYYTLDGGKPTRNSQYYTSAIVMENTSIIRAKAISSYSLPGAINTQSYFINTEHDLPVISLVTESDNLFSNDSGIYVVGNDINYPNYFQDWERPVHFEFFEPGDTASISTDAGLKIYGGWTRNFGQKSLALFARSRYGDKIFNYTLFPDLDIREFEAIVLRNSGNDWESTMFRDALMTGLMKKSGLDVQAYRPVVVYINGQYWGIHNLREKINEHFLASHHNIDANVLNRLERNAEIIQGNNNDYLELINYITQFTPAYSETYKQINNKMDIENFIKYEVSQIYFDNRDWPGNNIKFWNSAEDKKWRWILYDTDFGFGLFNHMDYSYNTLNFALQENGPDWPNPPWSTFLLRKLLENSTFKSLFINGFYDLINTSFQKDSINAHITTLASQIENEIPGHRSRWPQSGKAWDEYNHQTLRTFANNRSAYIYEFLNEKYSTGLRNSITITIEPPTSGIVKLNTLTLTSFPFSGDYYSNIPIELKAISRQGYIFDGWLGLPLDSSEQSILLDHPINITALFIKSNTQIPKIVINEINYNSPESSESKDWVEFYNPSLEIKDLSGWIFMDEGHSYHFPENTILSPGSYLVLYESESLFQNIFPNIQNTIGEMGFGLSGSGELIKLYDNEMTLIDSVKYDDHSPWPEEADGNGATLELSIWNEDNSLPGSWYASIGRGTPGEKNSQTVSVNSFKAIETFQLSQNFPNPFNSKTKIHFTLNKDTPIKLRIYNINGKIVFNRDYGILTSGNHLWEWDGKNQEGNALSTGLYIYQLITPHQNINKKMLLIK